MTATYNIVTIGSNQYDVYADISQADDYLAASTDAATWNAETDDDVKGRALVTATRFLDRQSWAGDKTDDNQVLDWPRSDTGISGVVDDEIPDDIVNAAIEIASALLNGVDIVNYSTSDQKEKSLKAGSVAVEYFRQDEELAYPLPRAIYELISPYYGGASTILSGSSSSGTDKCNPLNYGWDFNYPQ